MNTELMLHLKKFTAEDFGAMRTNISKVKEVIDGLNEVAQINMSRNQLQHLLENYYDLGQMVDAYEIFGGYVNRSFGIVVEKNGERKNYFVRKYKILATDKDILLEHKLVTFAKENGLDDAAGIIPAKDGSTFIRMDEEKNCQIVSRAFAVYDFLEGEDKYSWIETELLPEEDASFAELHAKFHNAARNFDPGDLVKLEPKIMDFLKIFPTKFAALVKQDVKYLAECKNFKEYIMQYTPYTNLGIQTDRVHDLWKESLDEINEMCKVTYDNLNKKELLEGMPYCYCHCDIHPGNVKWIDNKAVGIFDFDWGKLDFRLFDVAFALVYTCSSWHPQTDGRLWFDRCGYYLTAYNKFLENIDGLKPFTEAEKKAFPDMMIASVLYLLNWNSTYFEEICDLNEYEYLFYLVHTLRLMRYIDQHRDDLSELMKML